MLPIPAHALSGLNFGDGYVLAMVPASALQQNLPGVQPVPAAVPAQAAANLPTQKRTVEPPAANAPVEESTRKKRRGGPKPAKWRSSKSWPTPGASEQEPVKAASWRCAAALDGAAYESQVKSNAGGTVRHWPSIETPTPPPPPRPAAVQQLQQPQQLAWQQQLSNMNNLAALNATLMMAQAAGAQAAAMTALTNVVTAEKAGAAADALKLLAVSASGPRGGEAIAAPEVGIDDVTVRPACNAQESEAAMRPQTESLAIPVPFSLPLTHSRTHSLSHSLFCPSPDSDLRRPAAIHPLYRSRR